MTVRVLEYGGDGAYYLRDPANELDGLRDGGPGRVLGAAASVEGALRRLLHQGARYGALDVVVAAPKPVSLLLATETTAVARRVVALHGRATAAALSYLVADGGPWPDGLGAVTFTHGVNRRLDPHLHSHVLVGVDDLRRAGRSSRRLRWGARAADALYLAALREGLPRAASRAGFVGRSHATLVEGVDLALVAATSTPRSRGGALERGGPKRHPSRREVRERWAATLAASPPLGALPAVPADTGCLDEHRFAALLGTGTVRLDGVVAALATACTFGERPEHVLAASRALVPDGPAPWPAVLVRDDGGVAALGPRPQDPASLASWLRCRGALGRYLSAGHDPRRLQDPRGASAATLLALARLDDALGSERGRGPALMPRRAPAPPRARHRAPCRGVPA